MLAGPGDRRDEDLRAIAQAVAGRFDHYICRRDDNLRDRGPDEVPRIMAATLVAAGVPQTAISVIPDEQDAIDAALRMGRPGDLLLVFSDALVRSWKQIIYFRPEGAPAQAPGPPPVAAPMVEAPVGIPGAALARGADPRRARHPLRAGGVRLSEPAAPFDESRRLTGHNRFFDGTGAVLETDARDPALLAAWRAARPQRLRGVALARGRGRGRAAPHRRVARAHGARGPAVHRHRGQRMGARGLDRGA